MPWKVGNIYSAADALENLEALRLEITNATAQSRIAVLPAGTYRINCDKTEPASGTVKIEANSGAVKINDNVVIKGAGRTITTLRIGPDIISATTILFAVSPFKTLELHDLTIEGPPDFAGILPGDNGTNAPPCFGILHYGGGALILKNVTMRAWNQCIKADSHPQANHQSSIVTLADCVIGGRSLGLLHTDGVVPASASLTADRCVFEHDSNGFSGQHHNLYVGESVSITLRNCRFIRATRIAVNIWSAGVGRAPVFPSLIEDCEFDGPFGTAVITNKRALTRIRNCIFRCSSGGGIHVYVRGDTEIDGCTFEMSSNLDMLAIKDFQNANAIVSVRDCSFGGAYLYFGYMTESGSQQHWHFTRCLFHAPVANGYYFGIRPDVLNSNIEVLSSHFAEPAPRRLTNGAAVFKFTQCTRGPAYTPV